MDSGSQAAVPAAEPYVSRLKWSALCFLSALGGGFAASSSAAAVAHGALDVEAAGGYDTAAGFQLGLWLMVLVPTVLLAVMGIPLYLGCAIGVRNGSLWGFRFGTFCAAAGLLVLPLWAALIPGVFMWRVLGDDAVSADFDSNAIWLLVLIVLTAAAVAGHVVVSLGWIRQRRLDHRGPESPQPEGSWGGLRNR